MNFKREVLVGSLWSLLGNSGQQIIGFIIFIYIARTVTPADVGLIALALVLVSILMFVSRFGLVQALQRHVDLSDEMIDTAFWMLAVLGIVTTAAVFGSSYLAWTISDDPKLPSVLMYLSSLCALQAWNAVPEAVLRRRFDYRSLSLRNWIAALLGGAVGVYLAYHGYGVYALVAQRVATAIAQTVASWAFLRWHPRFRFNWDYAKHLFVVGGEIMLAGFAGVMNTKITDAGFAELAKLPKLESLYIWGTAVTQPAIDKVKTERKDLTLYAGLKPQDVKVETKVMQPTN